MTTPTMPNALPDGPMTTVFSGPDLSAAVVYDLTQRDIPVSTDGGDRAEHGRDWWPLTIGWINDARLPALAGAVVHARSIEDVSATLAIASRHHVPVTPQGGRSGVVGGAIPSTGGIALDLTGLNRILDFDPESATVRVEAGCFGPELEAFLNERGFTVGHFPQSFDLATVGGWLACRGAGQYSNRYGKIEDIVRGLTVVLADGSIVTTGGRGPRSAVGPDLTQVFVGAEGALGVIVEATLVVHHKPTNEARAAYSFDSVADGLDACRRILQRGARPAVLRLYDVAESQRNFSLDRCALIVLDEGDPGLLAATMTIVAEECATATSEDTAHVERWLGHRNDVSALGPLWAKGFVVDTIEVAGPWASLVTIHDRVTEALRAIPGTLVASVHQSHAYQDGACLYFTFVGRPEGSVDEYYRSAWDAASTAVLASGGALSHHHGVGRNRARFVREALGSGYSVLEALKSALDPNAVCNPGVLSLGGPAW